MSENQLKRVRRICGKLPETTEKPSHGAPTFFVSRKVFAIFSDNHHNDGHISVLVPAPTGVQEMLIEADPEKFYKPPYVGVRGWVGIDLDRVDDGELESHIRQAWQISASPRLHSLLDNDQS